MTITSTEHSELREITEPSELLIKEAREASRRRRLLWLTLLIAVALVASMIVASIFGSSKPTAQIGSASQHPNGNELAIVPCAWTAVSISNGPLVSEAMQENAHLLKITNTSSKSCLMNGYARLVVYGPTGAVIPFPLVHHATGGYAMTSRLPKRFALASHKSAYVLIAQVACEVGTETSAPKVALFLPKATHPSRVLTLLRPIELCIGQSASYANPIAISPIEPTSAATESFH
jgi:hypothetical protein